jgi:HAD superfamily hydrolase (TIGR01509 family)
LAGKGRRVIFWDSDGVLVETETLLYDATRQVLEEVGIHISQSRYAELALIRGTSVLESIGSDRLNKDEIHALRSHRDRIVLELLKNRTVKIGGVEEALTALRPYYRMAVVTGCTRANLTCIHESAGLTKFFELAVTREDYTYRKPHPDPYVTALERCGVSARECIAVEDSRVGVSSAVAAGILCYAIPGVLTRVSPIPGAAKTFRSIDELADELLTSALMCS